MHGEDDMAPGLRCQDARRHENKNRERSLGCWSGGRRFIRRHYPSLLLAPSKMVAKSEERRAKRSGCEEMMRSPGWRFLITPSTHAVRVGAESSNTEHCSKIGNNARLRTTGDTSHRGDAGNLLQQGVRLLVVELGCPRPEEYGRGAIPLRRCNLLVCDQYGLAVAAAAAVSSLKTSTT